MTSIKPLNFLLLLLCMAVALAACSPGDDGSIVDAEATAAAVVETRLAETAAAATATPTLTPSPLPTQTFTPTPTLTPTPTYTPTPTPTQFGGGGEIVFASNQDGDYDLFLINAAGEGQRKLTENDVDDLEPSWSPDGLHIAFVSRPEELSGIYVFSLEENNVQHVLDFNGGKGGSPTWTEDGQIFFWGQSSSNNFTHLFLSDLQGLNVIEIDPNNFVSASKETSYSVRGRQVAVLFRGNETGGSSIVALTFEGKRIWSLPGMKNIRDVSWSPDANQLAFSSTEGGTSDIYTADLRTGEVSLLIGGSSQDRYPSWSPDGTRLAFASDREGSWDLFTAAANGDDIQRITDDPADEIDPEWLVSYIDGNPEQTVSAEAAGMFEHVQEIYDLGLIRSTLGSYQTLPDSSISAEGRNMYFWETLSAGLDQFILRTNVSWEIVDENAAWRTSGCGFVYREQDNQNHYLMMISLDRSVYFDKVVGGEFSDMRNVVQKYGITQYFVVPEITRPSGSVELTFGVDNGVFFVFINGELIGTASSWEYMDGGLSISASSGTSQEGGITCEMTNIEVWELDK